MQATLYQVSLLKTGLAMGDDASGTKGVTARHKISGADIQLVYGEQCACRLACVGSCSLCTARIG